MTQYLNLRSFAEKMLTHEHACFPIRKDMPLDRAALIGCGVTTGIGAVIHTSNVRPGETVAVIGCGGEGLLAINGAAIARAGPVIALATVGSDGNHALGIGAPHFVNTRGGDAVAERIGSNQGGGEPAL